METLKANIKEAEGLRLYPYRDSTGHLTIGYGRCLENGISKAEAEIMLEADLYHASDQFMRLPKAVIRNCNTPRRRVLVEQIFQLGLSGTLKFKRQLRAIESGDYDEAAMEMIKSRWYQQTPNRVMKLAEIMKSGR